MIALLSSISTWAIPVLLAFIPIYGMIRRVPVYEAFIEGAEEGVRLSVRLAPYLLAILVGLGIFRDTGGLGLVVGALAPLLQPFGLPAEIIPLMVTRPLSGSGALGITADLIRTYGPDSGIGTLASILQGSTDTTFYVLSIYFGSVGVRHTRWALANGLAGDFAAYVAAAFIWQWMR